MIAAYLWLNAALYLVFAIWCTLAARSTARSLGYVSLDAAGESEYRVIYGGLQLGLAAIFAFLARTPSLHEVGLTLSLLLYAPLVGFRVWTLLRFRPPARTFVIGALEVLLLLAALALRLAT